MVTRMAAAAYVSRLMLMPGGNPMSTMNQTPAAHALEKLIRSGGVLDYGPDRSRLLLRIVRSLGERRPVSREQVEQISNDIGIGRDDADEFLSRVVEPGSDNTIVGTLGLTLNETSHHFTVNGKESCSPGAPSTPSFCQRC